MNNVHNVWLHNDLYKMVVFYYIPHHMHFTDVTATVSDKWVLDQLWLQTLHHAL